MRIEEFNRIADLDAQSELSKVARIAFYLSENKDQDEFEVGEVSSLLVALGYAHPNQARLKGNIKKSKTFVKGSKSDRFRLSVRRLAVGSEEARLRAGLRPPRKLDVRFSRIQLSRRHGRPSRERRY